MDDETYIIGELASDGRDHHPHESERIGQAIRNTEGALALIEGMGTMDDEQRFQELKRRSIEEAEEAYGQEACERLIQKEVATHRYA